MKKLLLITIMATIAFSSIAQYPIIEEDKSWDELNVIFTGSYPGDTSFYTTIYQFFGDTLINNISYNKLYRSQEMEPETWRLDCLMREDDSSKVWIYDEGEHLMYDFNVVPGDSISVGMDPNYNVYLFVDSITEVEINQSTRKKIWLSNDQFYDYRESWTEGIGSNKGLNWSGSVLIVGGRSWLLCVSKDNNLIYQNPLYESCYMVTDIVKNKNNTVKIYPNPVKDVFTISGNDEILSITIFDLNGRMVKQVNENMDRIDISTLTSGMYFVQIKNKKHICTYPIIKSE